MICVTGAGGTVGSEVVRQLQASGARFRAAYHSEAKAAAARQQGIDAVVMDYKRPETMRAALAGCDKLFLLGPPTPEMTELELAGIEAAKSAGVKHVVKLSVMGAGGEDYSFARAHRPSEKAIEASGMDWTFLRPNGFMQNFVNYMGQSIRARGAFYSAVGDARMSHVDVRDIAAVAVKALTEPGHDGKVFTLTGPEALSYDEMAAELSEALGRQVTHVKLSPQELKAGMLTAGYPEPMVDALLDLEAFYAAGRAVPVSEDVKRLTGREPRRFADTARDLAPALRA